MSRIPRSVLLLPIFMNALATVALAQDCLIFSSCSAAVQAWEDQVIEDYLALHQLPSTDRSVVVQYARDELRKDLRAYANTELSALATSSASGRTAVDDAMYGIYLSRILAVEIDAAQEAVNHKNALIGDMCRWKPDPELAKAFSYSYDGSFFCDLRHALFLGYTPPIIPSKQYFQAYGQKKVYFDPLKDSPDGLSAYQEISGRGKLTLALGAASLAIPLTLLVVTRFAQVTYYLSKWFFPKTGLGFTPVTTAITLAIMIIVIVLAVYLMYEGQAQIEALGQLDQELASVKKGVDIAGLTKDEKANARLTAAYTNMTAKIPGPYPPPPVRSSTDPLFVLTDAATGAVTTTDRISYKSWSSTGSAQMYRGWFLLGANFDDIGLKIRYLWNGKKYTLDRSAERLIVTKEEPAATDVECAVGPNGVSTAANLAACRYFTARSVVMDLPIGQRVVSLAQKPLFTTQMQGAFSIGAGPQMLNLRAEGLPIPRITLNSPLPAGVTFEGSDIAGVGSARLKYDGVSGTGDTSTLSFVAANDAESATSPYTLIIASAVKIVPPTPPTVTFGVASSFLIHSTGHPRPTFSVTGTGLPDPTAQPLCQMQLLNHGDGTASVIGTPQAQLTGPTCRALIKADNGFTKDTILVTFPGVLPPQPVLAVNKVDFMPGQQNSVTLKTAPFSQVPVWIQYPPLSGAPNYPNRPPDWLKIVNHGDGTATLSGIPPADAPEFFNVELQIFTDGANGFYREENLLHVHVVKNPLFTSPAYAFFDTVFSNYYLGTLSSPGTVKLVNSTLPEGLNLGSTGASYSIGGRVARGGETSVFLTANNNISQEVDGRWFRIIALEAPRFSLPPTVNFYIGQTKSVPILAAGFPVRPIEGIPNAPGPMRMENVGVLPNGLQLVSTDPDTGEQTYGKLMLSGKATTAGTTSITFSANNGVYPSASQAMTIRVTIPGDVNVDGKVDCNDVKMITTLYGQSRRSAQYDYNADYNMDGVIDVRDVAQVSAFLAPGTRCQ